MTRFVSLIIIIAIIAAIALAYLTHDDGAPADTTDTATTTLETYGMREYVNPSYGFTFWYPAALSVTATTASSTTDFPGGIEVERLNVGPLGGVSLAVVQSASGTITDEPDGHASPISQTKYFYDAALSRWMIAYPEGSVVTGASRATTTADISRTTVAALPMLPGGARFDTTIIPLSTTEFIVVQDGGASVFTSELAATVAPAGAAVDPSLLSQALEAESRAYAKQ